MHDFWKQSALQAYSETRDTVRDHLGRPMSLFIFGLFATFFLWRAGSPSGALDKLLELGAYLILAVVFFGLLFLRNIKTISAKKFDQAVADTERVSAENNALKEQLQKLKTLPPEDGGANWPIQKLFRHIRPDILEDPNDADWELVGRAILDRLSQERLVAWGRPYLGSPEETERNSGQKRIPLGDWDGADFTYQFFSDDYRFVPHTRPTPGSAVPSYADLQVNEGQARGIAWHAGAPGTTLGFARPDFNKWDQQDVFRLFEVAWLWVNREPSLPLRRRPEQVYYDLKGAISNRTIYPTLSIGEILGMEKGDHFGTKFDADAPINPNTVVGREALTRYAEAVNVRPMFLFKGARERG
jgi:hypothetical protein